MKLTDLSVDCIYGGTLPVTGGTCFVKGERGLRASHPECVVAALKEQDYRIVKLSGPLSQYEWRNDYFTIEEEL